MRNKNERNFIRKIYKIHKINTRSYEQNNTLPSSKEQEEFLKMLEKELIDLGLSDVHITKGWFLTATLKANTDKKYQILAL